VTTLGATTSLSRKMQNAQKHSNTCLEENIEVVQHKLYSKYIWQTYQ